LLPGSSLAAQRQRQRDECADVAERDRKVSRRFEFIRRRERERAYRQESGRRKRTE